MFAFLTLVLAAGPTTLDLSSQPDEAQLVNLLWEYSPELQLTRSRVAAARADSQRALYLPNPTLDLSANTLPVGETNPAGLTEPLANIPNYAFSVSELIEIGKRGPRQESTKYGAVAAVYDARALLVDRYHDLEEAIGEVAASEQRIAQLTELVADADKLSSVQRARADKGDTALLDADRALLEEQKLQTALAEEQARLLSNLRACSVMAGVGCLGFNDVARANAWLRRLQQQYPADAVEQRPDILSLGATAQSARAAQSLAEAKAIPDPTVRLGYVRDQFLVSGNQQNSLFVGVSVPIPLFDHGQADAAAAAVAADAASRSRQRLIDAAHVSAERYVTEAASLQSRRDRLSSKTLPLARSVVDRLDAAVQRGGADIQDLLLARHTLGELLLEAADLDLTIFRLDVERSRTAGRLPVAPKDLVME